MGSLRSGVVKTGLNFGFKLLIQSGSWREPLLESLKPRSGEKILDVSIDGWNSGVELARRFPTVSFVSLDPNATTLLRNFARSIENLEFLTADNFHSRCPGASVDKVVCSLALHSLQPQNKVLLLRDMLRVLRHGGTLHLADYDRPHLPRESNVLKAISYLHGRASAEPHLSGTWVDLISNAGFVGVRRLSSCPELLSRVTLIRARRL